MTKNRILLGVLVLSFALNAQNMTPKQQWELTGFNNPESIVLDAKNNVLYVSNINGEGTSKDGNGYISKVSTDGKVLSGKWVEGLNAPKGLAIYKDMLFVADIDELVEISISQKKIIARHKAEGATFLNDVAVDKNGNVYTSNTFGFSAIYRLSNGKLLLWIKDEKLNMPNGLFAKGKYLYVAGWGEGFDPATYATKILGHLLKINIGNKAISMVSKPIGNLDGLQAWSKGFLMTDWMKGELIYYDNKNNSFKSILSLSKGSADLTVNKKGKEIYIPFLLDNKIQKYTF